MAKSKTSRKTKRKRYPRKSAAQLGNQGGRPREWTEADINLESLALEKWMANPNNYFFTAFLNERKLHPEQIERFSNYNAGFRELVNRARRIQEQRLVQMAIDKPATGGFIKFVLQNKNGWREKTEVSGDQQNPLRVIMDRIEQNSLDVLDYDE